MIFKGINLNIYTIGIVFFIINLVMLIIAPYDVHLAQGADAGSWYHPALSLLKHGSFVTLEDTTVLQTYRPPLYLMYEAFMLFIGNGNIVSIIIGQILLLWLTGRIMYKIVERIFPKKGILALVLVIFNPNALGTAHLVQSDILYMFMISATLYYLLLYNEGGSFKLSILIGFMLGLACLVRPSGQYLIPFLPVIYVIIGLLKKSNQPLLTHFYHGFLSIIVAVIVVFPWAQHNANAGWGYNLSTSEIEVVYFKDNVIYLESILSNKSLNESGKIIQKNEQDYISSYDNKWLQMSKQDKSSIVASYYKKQIFTYNYKIIVKGFVDSWIGLFGSGGAANLHNILALDGSRSIQVMANSEKHMSRIEAVFTTLMESNFVIITISLLSFIYVIVLRIFGLIGLINIIKDRKYGVLFILTGVVFYFMLIALFVGNSRYRLPIEPALIIMAIYGFNATIKRK
jgi:4-amino-4-deoxy-L-arabinose transferase-like glycosyltransferase